MTWVKLSDNFGDDPRVLELGDRAAAGAWLFVRCLCYSNRHLTDGRIPAAFTRAEDPGLLQAMVGSGLLVAAGDGAFLVDVADQPTSAEVLARREAWAERQKKKRGMSRGESDGDSERDTPRDSGRESTHPVPFPFPVPNPDPSPVPAAPSASRNGASRARDDEAVNVL